MSLRSTAAAWVRRIDWLWSIIGGFYLIAYLFWYVEALADLPESLRDPPGDYPPHWPLDFTATGVTGSILLYLGFRRATELSTDESTTRSTTPREEPSERQSPSPEDLPG